jgi:tartrate dehydratase beta subunit/fumarate hydratase class I family protein
MLISIKLRTKHPWVKKISNLQVKDQVLFKGEIITKMEWGHSKIIFSRTTGPEKLRFT